MTTLETEFYLDLVEVLVRDMCVEVAAARCGLTRELFDDACAMGATGSTDARTVITLGML